MADFWRSESSGKRRAKKSVNSGSLIAGQHQKGDGVIFVSQ
jgi:hypothetical protein